jgi:hypothetical protein
VIARRRTAVGFAGLGEDEIAAADRNDKERAMMKRIAVVLAMGGMLGLGVVARAASVTPVAPDPLNLGWVSSDGRTAELDYVLGQAYGYTGQGSGNVAGTLTWGGGAGMGGITFTRVLDEGGTTDPLHVNGSNSTTADDRIWSDGLTNLNVEVKIAGYNQLLGWKNLLGGGDGALIDYGAGQRQATVSLSGSFLWYDDSSPSGGGKYYSDPNSGLADASDAGQDHMVTYRVQGKDLTSGNYVNAYVICFEDIKPLASSDHDYNDLVVQVTPVPLPAAAGVGFGMLAGFGGLFGLRKQLKRRTKIA